MARKPDIKGDRDNWGDVLNEYLGVSLDEDGAIREDVAAALPISDATQAALDQMPPGRRALVHPEGLDRFRTRLASARYRQVHIAVAGDSITEGSYANDAGTGNYAVWLQRGWVGQLRSLFADRYGDPGRGLVMAGAADASQWTPSGGAVLEATSSVGIFGARYGLTNGHTVTMTTPPCTDIDVYVWSFEGAKAVSYTVDGGSVTPGHAGPGSDDMAAFRIAGLTDEPHTLVIYGPDTGMASLLGVLCYRETDAGVGVHRVALSGMTLKDLTRQYDADDATGNRSLDSIIRLVYTGDGLATAPVDLLVLAFSANNVTRGWNTHGQTPAQVAAGFGRVMDRAIALGTDVLVVAGPRRDPATYSTPSTQDDYDDAVLAEVAARDHAAAVDLRRVWGTFASGDALGLYWDTVHPTLRGHSDIAALVYQAIGGV